MLIRENIILIGDIRSQRDSPGLDGGKSGVNILWNDISSVHDADSHMRYEHF